MRFMSWGVHAKSNWMFIVILLIFGIIFGIAAYNYWVFDTKNGPQAGNL